MNEYYEVIDLAPIPTDLLDPIEKIVTFENKFPDKTFAHTYASYKAPKPLNNYVQSLFDYPVFVTYQVIHKQLPKHVDVGIVGKKYNYLLDTGGDVSTRWYEDDKLVFEVKSKPFIWHTLKIDTMHDITAPTHTRLSVVVRQADA